MAKRAYAYLGISAAVTLLLDQATKAIVAVEIPPGRIIPIWPGHFDLVNLRNRGAAFGFLNNPDTDWQFWLFLVATLAAIAAIFALARGASGKPGLATGLGLVLGGALGNLIDRARFRSVLDFLDFYWGDWHWPAFNVADMGICAGAFLTCLALWGKEQKT